MEGKLNFRLDKRIGNFLVATNWIAEYEWVKESPETKEELELEATLSAGYFIKPTVMFGAEVRTVTEIEREEEHTKWELPFFTAVRCLRMRANVGGP